MNKQIETNFSYHAPKEGQPEVYEAIRNKAKEFAYLIDNLVQNGEEKSEAMKNLRQVVFWVNAGIACNSSDSTTEICVTKHGIIIDGTLYNSDFPAGIRVGTRENVIDSVK